MGELSRWAEAAVISAEVAMALGKLDVADKRLEEARMFARGAAERGESYLAVSQEIGVSEARLIVARINERRAS